MCLKCSHKKNQNLKLKPVFFYGLYYARVSVYYHLQSVFSVQVSSANKREDFYDKNQ